MHRSVDVGLAGAGRQDVRHSRFEVVALSPTHFKSVEELRGQVADEAHGVGQDGLPPGGQPQPPQRRVQRRKQAILPRRCAQLLRQRRLRGQRWDMCQGSGRRHITRR